MAERFRNLAHNPTYRLGSLLLSPMRPHQSNAPAVSVTNAALLAAGPSGAAALSTGGPPISAAAWAARPRRQPYQAPGSMRVGARAPSVPPPVRDELFSRYVQEGIKKYRTAYNAHTDAHFQALRAGPPGNKARPLVVGADPCSRLAAEHATNHVRHISEYVSQRRSSDGTARSSSSMPATDRLLERLSLSDRVPG